MNETFKTLLDTKDLWLPALTWTLGQLSATQTGMKIEEGIKKRLKWLKDPEAEKAFQEAFNKGIENYQKSRQGDTARAVARVLTHIATHDTALADRALILEQIFADRVDSQAISQIVSRNIFALEGLIVHQMDVKQELITLVGSYLRPAFRSQRYFSEVVGFAEVIGLLRDIKEVLTPSFSADELQRDYFEKTANKYELITMQGISPKVQNRTIGIRMKDVFIPLEATIISSSYRNELIEWLDWFEKSTPSHYTSLINLAEQRNLSRASISKLYKESIRGKTRLADQLFTEDMEQLVTELIFTTEDMTVTRNPRRVKSFLNLLKAQGVTQLKDLAEFSHLVVQGHPGSGKSTVVKYMCWAIASSHSELVGDEILTYIPIPIRAVEFGDSLQKGQVDSLDEFLLEQAGRFAPLFKFALSAGKAFIFIDGLDEVGLAALRSRVKERVDDFVADPAFSDNRMLITTRIVGYQPDGITGKFPHFQLKDLDDPQISKFIENWYQAIHDEIPSSINVEIEKKQLLDAVLKNPSIHRMAINPLLLTIIALIKWQGRTLPEQRVLLYDAAAQTLIKSWPAQRSMDFDDQFIREWLAPVAEKIFETPTSDLIDEYTLTDELIVSMLKLKSMSKPEARIETLRLLENISLHSGILLPRGTDEDGRNLYGFMHQTFAEYLAAYSLAGKWENGQLDLKKYAHDPYWREVLLLMAGHLSIQRRSKAGQLLRAIIELRSSDYEDFIHRDLLLAARILADGVGASADIVEQVIGSIIQIWHRTKSYNLRADIELAFAHLKSTEYRPVLVRLSKGFKLEAREIIRLCETIGTNDFEDDLINTLSSTDVYYKLRSATLLAQMGKAIGRDTLLLLLEKSNDYLAADIGITFMELNDNDALIAAVEKYAEIKENELDVKSFFGVTEHNIAADKREILLKTLENVINVLSLRAQLVVALKAAADQERIDFLIRCLNSDNIWVRCRAAFELYVNGVQEGTNVLMELAYSENEKIRVTVEEILLESKDVVPVSVLQSIIEQSDGHNRVKAIITLFSKYGNRAGVPVLLDILCSKEKHLVSDALLALRAVPDIFIRDDIDYLIKQTDLSDDHYFATILLKNFYSEGVDLLKAQMKSKDPSSRYYAAEALRAKTGDKEVSDDEYDAILMELLDTGSLSLRFDAAKELLARGYVEGLDTLLDLTRNEDAELRYLSIYVLLDTKSLEVFSKLEKDLPQMFNDYETFGRRQIQSVSGRIYEFISQNIAPNGEITKAFTHTDLKSYRRQ